MQLQAIILTSAIIATTRAIETHGCYQYETRFSPNGTPEVEDVKDPYEIAAAKQAFDNLRKGITATNIASQCLTESGSMQPADIYALKDCIATDNKTNFFTILAEDIQESNAFWDKVVAESTLDRTQWVPARSYTKGYFNGNLTATQFAAWTLSPNADAANLNANPEHYYKETVLDATGTQASEIFEGWGGVLSTFGTKRTHFTVPEFATPMYGSTETPESWNPGASFPLPLQRVGEKLLVSGSKKTFGVLQIGVRDFAASEGSTGMSGIEVYSAVWYPPWDQASDADQKEFVNNYLADEAHHMVVEVINLTLQAHEDCKSGLCVLPSSS